ncbi:MAG: TonB-dependent receptor [Bacteroidota bacterium]
MKRPTIYLFWLVAAILCLGTTATAQTSCKLSLSGIIRDVESGKPMPYVNVYLKEAEQGAVTDHSGRYTINGLCSGEYTVACSHIGCHHYQEKVLVARQVIKNFTLKYSDNVLEKIVVKSQRLPLGILAPGDELSGDELSARQAAGFGKALEALPGVRTLNTGASISKPVIQGLHSNRVLVLNNGIRQEGQQWGMEHAPEIDPFAAEKLKVIKGAGAVRYGADAIGGVVLMEPRALPATKGWQGGLQQAFQSNGRQLVSSAFVETKLGGRLPLSGRLQGTYKKGGNQRSPDYFLANTGLEEYNFSYAIGLEKERFGSELYYSQFNTRLGVFSGAHIGNLTDLRNAFEAERPRKEADFTYDLERPQQKVEHELFKAKSWWKSARLGKFEWQYSRQYNLRQEFDAHSIGGRDLSVLENPEIEFRTTTHAVDFLWEHKKVLQLEGMLGAQYQYKRSKVNRGGLIPGSEQNRLGLFWLERWRSFHSLLELEFGLRYDYLVMDVRAGESNEATELQYDGFSSTLGMIYRPAEDWRIHVGLGTAWRSPNVNELFSDGVHHGAASFEKGRVDLGTEKALNTQLNIRYEHNNISVEIAPFFKLVDDFIYLQPSAEPVLTIRGAFPAFQYEQAKVRLWGTDAQVNYKLGEFWEWQSRYSTIRARNLDEEEGLVLMPADRFQNQLQFNLQPDAELPAFVRLSMVHVLRQGRVPPEADYVPPPAAYHLLNLEAAWPLQLGKQQLTVGLNVSNLLDTAYRDYLNRFRYFADDVGRNITFYLKMPIGKNKVH